MTPTVLLDELADYLYTVNSKYWVTEKREKTLTVQAGFLKKRQAASEQPFPYIVPRFMKSVDGTDGSTVTVRIYFGSYSEDVSEGWREVLSLIENSRLALLKQRTLAKCFRLQLPLEVEVTEDQPYPEWVGYITATYTMPTPDEELALIRS